MKRIFYGWWVLLALLLTYMITNGIILNTLPLFNPQLMDEFGLDNRQISKPAQVLYFLVAIMASFVGFLLDRYSPRRIMLIGAFILLIALAAFANAQSFRQIRMIYMYYAIGLTLSGIVSSMYILTQWFVKYRGLAVGILLMGSSLGGALFNKIAGMSIVEFGWRGAAWILFGCAVVGMALPLLLIVRDNPAKLGLLPDGEPFSSSDNSFTSPSKVGITLPEAVTSTYFYLLLIATATLWFCITGIVNHQVIFIEKDLGKSKEVVTNVTSLFFLCSIVGKLLFGWLSDRFNKLSIMLLSIVNLLIGTVLLRYLPVLPPFMMYVYSLVYGIAFSGAFTMIQIVVAEEYNGIHYGRILGIFTTIDTIAGSLGIASLGTIRKSSGSYLGAFELMIALCILACLCVLAMKYIKRSQLQVSSQ